MITIRFNGENITVDKHDSLATLLLRKGYTEQIYAVSMNKRFIPRTQHQTTLLQENDLVEIIMPMQGG